MARGTDLTIFRSIIVSFANLIGARQFATLGIIWAKAPFMEMVMAQLIINLRYYLISCSLSQELSTDIPFFRRFLVSHRVMDEIFGVPVCCPGCSDPFYSYGLICVTIPGWTPNTLLGAVSEELLLAHLLSALNMTLYGMFLAVVIPPVKASRILIGVILVSMALSLVFVHVPFLADLPSDFKIVLLTVLIASAAAILFPTKGDNGHES